MREDICYAYSTLGHPCSQAEICPDFKKLKMSAPSATQPPMVERVKCKLESFALRIITLTMEVKQEKKQGAGRRGEPPPIVSTINTESCSEREL
jgi:hypothetical protein